MKEEKLFEIVNNIDDDLICEMLDYSPDTERKGDVSEGALYSGPQKARKIYYWKYPVTAAVLMLALVGVLFIFNSNNILPYNAEETTDSEQRPAETTDDVQSAVTTTDDPYTPVDTNIPYEFTEEDKELQRFLEKTAYEALKYQGLYDGGYFGDIGWQVEGDQDHEGVISAIFPQMEQALDKQISMEYVLLSDELSFKTRDELEEELSLYYSSEIVSQFMGYVGIGEITERTENGCLIEIKNAYLDENGFLYSIPRFIEINGRLYRDTGAKGGWFTPNWSMAKVISKTDEELIFSYLGYGMDDIKEIRAGLGRLKYEDGWKYDWWDICSPYEMVDFEEVWVNNTGAVQSSPLDLLHCRTDGDGIYRVDQDVVTDIDDYDLFRQYFFGTWEGSLESERMVIDDSMKSFNMNQHSTWYSGLFYKIGENTLAFIQGGSGGPMVYWLDMNDPETLYYAYGEVENWLWSTNKEETEPVVSSLKKSDLPPNEPEDGFLSIFKLYDMSQDYGIDFYLLVEMTFGYEAEGSSYLLSHNGYALFYPVYLVSESADRLDLKTKIGTGLDEDPEIEVSYTFERSDGMWTRTVSASSLNQEVTLIGNYDRSSLVDFDYSEILAKIAARDDMDTGNFLDDGYSEFKELYQKAYALTGITVSNPDNFPNVVGLGSPAVKWEDAVQIHVTDESYPIGYRTYYLTGYNWVSFYNEMTEVFTTEQADELIFGNKLFYNYEGALWCSNAATGGDMTRVHTEYAVEKTDDTLDIIRTTYHVQLGETPEFDPEKIDEYETKETHFVFTKFGNRWLASEFADVR